MKILALDIGTRMGWAVASEDAPPIPAAVLGDESEARAALRHYRYGLWTDASRDRGKFYVSMTRWLTSQIDTFDIGLLVIEANAAAMHSVRSQEAALKLFGITAMAEATAWTRGIRCQFVHTGAVQKVAVGTGRDTGKKLRKARMEALGIQGDDNVGDAVWALSWVLHQQAQGGDDG